MDSEKSFKENLQTAIREYCSSKLKVPPIIQAVVNNSRDSLTAMLGSGHSIAHDPKNPFLDNLNTVHCAVIMDRLELLKYLIDEYLIITDEMADIPGDYLAAYYAAFNEKSTEGFTPFHFSCLTNNHEIAELLLGARFKKRDVLPIAWFNYYVQSGICMIPECQEHKFSLPSESDFIVDSLEPNADGVRPKETAQDDMTMMGIIGRRVLQSRKLIGEKRERSKVFRRRSFRKYPNPSVALLPYFPMIEQSLRPPIFCVWCRCVDTHDPSCQRDAFVVWPTDQRVLDETMAAEERKRKRLRGDNI